MKDLKFGENVDLHTRGLVTFIIEKYWDCFVKEEAKRTILRYEFSIDTGGAKYIYSRKPSYGLYESKILMAQFVQLLDNGWIEKCVGPWGIMVVLVQKPHQEHFTNIDHFIWQMCILYRKLNDIIKPFQFPVLRRDNAITILSWGVGEIWIIILDARQGYHQVAVRKMDR